jgi:hypothetical protein
MKNAPSPLRSLCVDDRVLAATGFLYVHCDVPTGMRLDQWHFARNRARRAAVIHARRQRRAALVANLRRCIPRP